MFLLVLGVAKNDGPMITYGLLFCALQPIVSMCMTMTKADVRKYTLDLIAFSYCRNRNNNYNKPEETPARS
jgi:hypothetical protein